MDESGLRQDVAAALDAGDIDKARVLFPQLMDALQTRISSLERSLRAYKAHSTRNKNKTAPTAQTSS